MANVVVLGPNGIDGSNGASFHVHASTCQDLRNYTSSEFRDDKANVLDMDSVEEISAYVYDFEEHPEDLVNDFYVFPCVNFEKEVPMTKVTFELYSEDIFFAVEIETSDLGATLELLGGMNNVRNIQY